MQQPRIARLPRLLVVGIVALASLAAPWAAGAAQAAAPQWSLNVTIHQNGGADAVLSDTLTPGLQYLLTLTAAGGGTCTLLAGTSEVADEGVGGFANPVAASTQGSCDLYDGTVNYTVTWTPLGAGSPGQLPIQCAWALAGAPRCTPTSLSGHLVSGLPD